jgi:hypothetical protein
MARFLIKVVSPKDGVLTGHVETMDRQRASKEERNCDDGGV